MTVTSGCSTWSPATTVNYTETTDSIPWALTYTKRSVHIKEVNYKPVLGQGVAFVGFSGGLGQSLLTPILLITAIVVLNLFYWSTKSLLLGMKCVSKHQDLQMFVLKLNKYG